MLTCWSRPESELQICPERFISVYLAHQDDGEETARRTRSCALLWPARTLEEEQYFHLWLWKQAPASKTASGKSKSHLQCSAKFCSFFFDIKSFHLKTWNSEAILSYGKDTQYLLCPVAVTVFPSIPEKRFSWLRNIDWCFVSHRITKRCAKLEWLFYLGNVCEKTTIAENLRFSKQKYRCFDISKILFSC